MTGTPWRHEDAEPQRFYETMVAAGADPTCMSCVRTVFERTRNGSLVEPPDAFGAIEAVTGRPATSLRRFLERERALFAANTP